MKYVRIVLLLALIQFSIGANEQLENIEIKSVSKNDFPQPYEIRQNSIGMEFVWIPPGEFMMGSRLSESELKEKYEDAMLKDGLGTSGWEQIKTDFPQHPVNLTKGYWIGRHEVTQAQYKSIMGNNPSYFRYKCPHCRKFIDPDLLKDDVFSDFMQNYPVETILWFQTQEFCYKLSRKENKTYKLPTEAQWEYACRAGSTTVFSFGDDFKKISEYAWYDGNSSEQTHSVGQKKPNAWGLYDMHGNVSEWCLDRYDPNFYSDSPKIDPICTKAVFLDTDLRVVRGGNFASDNGCRSASRSYSHNAPIVNDSLTGFRVICEDL